MKQRHKRTSRSFKDANVRLPEDFTSHLDHFLTGLPPSPRNDYLRQECLSKFVSSTTLPASDRKNAAIRKWLVAERDNEATNDRLLFTPEDFQILPRVNWSVFIAKCQEVVEAIIGATVPWMTFVNEVHESSFEWTRDIAMMGSFSGGASTSRNRACSYPANKYLGKLDATESAAWWFRELIPEMPGWSQFIDDLDQVNIVEGNVMFMVPKTAVIDRCACKEPDINMFLQKGLGDLIRASLRKQGIDLNDQSTNNRLARQGSIDGSLATLDLSSASDSVTTGLCQLLLPVNWFTVLSDLRSPVTSVFGELHRNEMFSSMGNGFTFELQSLLFYALARTTAYFRGSRGVISVYGDDIVVPSTLAQDLVWVLQYMGFSVNPAKSFWSGPFRESCGGHYYNGSDITPFYVKKPVLRLLDLIHLGNSLRKWGGRGGLPFLDPDAEDLWISIRDQVPKQFWGGRDLNSKEALVTPDLPAKRLVSVTARKGTGTGGYVAWLNAMRFRVDLGDAVETSFRTVDSGTYRVKPNRTPYTWLTSPLFMSEWCARMVNG